MKITREMKIKDVLRSFKRLLAYQPTFYFLGAP